MDVSPIQELLDVLAEVRVIVVAFGVVAFFATLAILLWSWRRVALEDDE
jgi:hypothetical protein